MFLDHYDRFFTFATAGLGLFLAGALNLALGRGGRRVWLRAVVTLAVCGLVVAGLSALTQPAMALRAGAVLAIALLGTTLLGSAWFGRQVAILLAVFHKPAARWGLVASGGLAVVLASSVAFDQADRDTIDQGMQNLVRLVDRVPHQPTNEARAATDRGNQIVLKIPSDPREGNALHAPEEKTLREAKFRDQLIRRGGPTDHSNCHGWVFTNGKFLLSPDDVEVILKENGYSETQEPQSGDLVVYRREGEIIHTAIVRYVTEGQPVLVEGKWGAMGVFLHPADHSFYGNEYTFHRSARGGHLLAGLGGSPGPAVETVATAE